jgi:hypothetical protein
MLKFESHLDDVVIKKLTTDNGPQTTESQKSKVTRQNKYN